MTYTFPARSEVQTEAVTLMSGFRAGVAGKWLIKRAEHYVGSDGYRTSIECELLNTDANVEQADAAEVTDSVQLASEAA